MNMWLLDSMEVQFAAAMGCLLLDLGRRYYKSWRPVIVGVLCTGALLFSLADLLLNWPSNGAVIPLQPTDSANASLYSIDKLGVFVIFVVLVIGIAVSLYSWKSLNQRDRAGPFFAALLLLFTSLIGIAVSGDLLTLFLFWEGMSIAAYGLVAFRKEVAISLEAALKYLFIAGTGSLLALFGISLVYSLTGSIQLTDLARLNQVNPQLGLFALIMLIIGLGVEAAFFPMHTWLPDAYSTAPSAVSAALAGVVTEVALFGVIRIVNPSLISINLAQTSQSLLQSVQIALAVVAFFTMFIGNIGAFAQSNVRRLLSFSSIAHIGYMLAALSTMTVLGLTAILLHIWNHGLAKSSFFMLAGTAGDKYDDSELPKMEGMIQRNEPIGGMYALSSVAMMGVPPFGMFWSELLIIQSLFAVHSVMLSLLAVAVVVNIFISVGYFSKVINTVALKPSQGGKSPTPWRLLFAPIVLLILSILTGLAPWIFLSRIA